MKRLNTILVFASFLLLSIGTFSAFAQYSQSQSPPRQHATQDKNGDGICDVCGQPVGSGQSNAQGEKATRGKHFGPGDGTGNSANRPQDGTGYGSQSGRQIGPQDGSGAGSGGFGSMQGQRGGRRGGRP
jgi:hypothetical protein